MTNLRGTGYAVRDTTVRELRARIGGMPHVVEINVTGTAGFLLAKTAAAPQAAGLAALYWSRHPKLSATEVRHALCNAARDVLAPGHDPESGYGLMRLPPIE